MGKDKEVEQVFVNSQNLELPGDGVIGIKTVSGVHGQADG